ADGREQIPRQPVSRVVGRAACPEAAEVAGRAGGGGEVAHGQRSRLGVPVPVFAARRVGDSMRRFLINFPLRMIGTDVAGIAGFRSACLFQTELVAQMALLAFAHRTVGRGSADVVAALAGKARDRRTFDVEQCLTSLVWTKCRFGD